MTAAIVPANIAVEGKLCSEVCVGSDDAPVYVLGSKLGDEPKQSYTTMLLTWESEYEML